MLKKFVLAFLVFFGTSLYSYGKYCGFCHVDESCNFCPDCDFDTYIGVVGGVGFLSGSYKQHNHATEEFHLSKNKGTSGLVGGVFGFQTYVCNKFYAALQANFLYNHLGNGRNTVEGIEGNVAETLELENSFQGGIDARFGRFFYKLAAYFIFGFEAGHWTFNFINERDTFFRGIPPHRTLTHIKCLAGPRIGAGMTFPIIDCVWLNFEYSYTWFGTYERHLRDPLTGEWDHKIKVHQQSVLAGVNFLF